ncbi:hypothetical protein TWF281_007777 [Arthrobotrys megalospora]
MRLKTFNSPITPKSLFTFLFILILNITGVYSQSADCAAQNRTVNSQADLDALSDCVTLTGNLDFGSDIVNATINGIQTIRGSLTVPYSAKIQRLIAPDLSFIGGIIHIKGALNLTVLRMPSLANLGAIRFENLPVLRSVEFSSQVDSLGGNTAVQLSLWNTAIESLADVIYRNVESVQIVNNPNLFDINLPIRNITGIFEIRYNGADSQPTRVTFPYLESAGYISMGSDVGEVNLPNLTHVDSTLEITSKNLTKIELPNLVTIGQERLVTGSNSLRASVEIYTSPNLETVSFPKLEWIKSYLRINGSEKWTNLNGFPVLETVGEGVIIDGSFTNVEFPQLRAGDSESTFFIASPAIDCGRLLEEPVFTKGDWKTNITCNGNAFDLTPDDNNAGEKGNKLSGGAIGGIAVGALAAVGVSLSILFICFRRKGYTAPWRKPLPPKIPELHDEEAVKVELGTGDEAVELDNPKIAPELEGSIPLAELEGTGKVVSRAPKNAAKETTEPPVVKPPEQS